MKSRIQLWSGKLFKPVEPIPSGMYHYQSPEEFYPAFSYASPFGTWRARAARH